tara:strand:+ start:447 stop:1019 length:573 start_codon:yes stop_codon:yes gene_type:complete
METKQVRKTCKYCKSRIGRKRTVCSNHTYAKRKAMELRRQKREEMKPWNELFKRIKKSASTAGTGGQAYTLLRESGKSIEEVKEMYKRKAHYVSSKINGKSLKRLFEVKQDSRNYWTGQKMDINDITEAMCLSADRLYLGKKMKHGYNLNNIGITTRGINRMRGEMEQYEFVKVLEKMGMPINKNLYKNK